MDVDLSAISYQDRPSFSPDPFDYNQFDVEDLLGDKDDDSTGGAQPDTDPAQDDTAAAPAPAPMPMENAHLEDVVPLQVNGHQGPQPAGVDCSPIDISMGKAPGDIDFSTATDKEIMDHARAFLDHRKDKQEVPKFDDDQVHLEPWRLKQRSYRATKMVSSDDKTLEGGCWKEAEFMGIRRTGPFYFRDEMRPVGLRRTLEFYKKDGTKTTWRMFEYLSLRFSDGHVFLEDNYGVQRYVYQEHPAYDEFFYSDTSRISVKRWSWIIAYLTLMAKILNHPFSGVGKDQDNQNSSCTLRSECLHHHYTEQNNQAPLPSGKRPRTDDDPKKTKLNVWQHFTRIYIKVPKEAGSSKTKKDSKKLVYAVCNYCDKVFKADSKQGTSHHGRHAEYCMRKHSQSHPSSSKSCSQDIPSILEARKIVSGDCGNEMLCV